MVVHKGPRHDYLGITLDYSSPGKVIVDMKQYINKIFSESPPDIKGVAQTPAGQHLLKLNPDFKHLDAPSAMMFHHLVAHLLFLTKQAHPDILMAVAFLTTCIQSPNWDDYKKLAKVLNYLQNTHDLVLTLEASNAGVAEWWIDGAFGNHSDMQSHTGGCLSLGTGMVMSKSMRQKTKYL